MQKPVDLPADFVARYDGVPVAFTGYEVDSVYTLPNGSDVSVPITTQCTCMRACVRAWVGP